MTRTPIIEDCHGVTVVYTLGDNELYVDFHASEITGFDCYENGVYRGNGYADPDGNTNMPTIYDPAKGEVYVCGSVKWDGCVNYFVGQDHDTMMHACGLDDIRRLSLVLEHIYRKCAEIMPKNDYAHDKGMKR